ncbi:MAG TPA: hypothetical protein VEC36_10470, partial [Patescibacteria group bacterium]|nr:hypothetical protein [Patescibacteria group bacterium]
MQNFWRHDSIAAPLSKIAYADSNHFIGATNRHPAYDIIKSVDGGSTWQEILQLRRKENTAIFAMASDIAHPTRNSVFVIVDSVRNETSQEGKFNFQASTLFFSRDGGLTWTQKYWGNFQSEEERSFKNIIMNDSLNGVMIQMWSDSNKTNRLAPVLYTKDGGNSWTEVSLPESDVVIRRHPHEDHPVLASHEAGKWIVKVFNYVTESDELWKTVNYGKTWEQLSFPLEKLQKVIFKNEMAGYSLGYKGGYNAIAMFAKTVDGGKSWTTHEFPAPNTFRAPYRDIDFIDEMNGIIASYDRIWRTIDGGISWQEEYVGNVDTASAGSYINQM